MTGGSRIALLLLALCQCSIATNHVPVLIWNTNQAQGGVPAVSALQHINYGNFQAKYLASFKPNNILLFLQDALSAEDLTSHTTELHHIKNWMESGHSLFLPNVEDAAHLVHDLPAHGYNVLKLDHDAGLNLKQDDKNLVVVELPSTLTNPSRRRALQKADEVMENVISKIGDQRDFTIIFTGKKPSVDEPSDQFEHLRVGARSLKALDEYYIHNCTKVYLRNDIKILLYRGDELIKTELLPNNKTSVESFGDCTSDPAVIKIKYKDITLDNIDYSKVDVTFNFPKNKGSSWTLSHMTVAPYRKDSSDTPLRTTFKLTNKMDNVPVGMSFSCSEKYYLNSNEAFLGYTSAKLLLERFQMQAFSTKDKFDNAWDCVGFFTVPIWCGLLITILLVGILTFGLFMLSEIKTMDRFDDPKGQPITVATTNE